MKSVTFRLCHSKMDEDYQDMVEEYVRRFKGGYFVISVEVDGFYTVYFTRIGRAHV